MDERVGNALKAEYLASLEMLRDAVERCPEDLWGSAGKMPAVWQIAYHTLFFTHLYLQPGEAAFRPWEVHERPDDPTPLSREEVLRYLAFVESMVGTWVDALDLESPDCGFPWYKVPKLNHQLVNIRHVQGHVGQIDTLLRQAGLEAVDWTP